MFWRATSVSPASAAAAAAVVKTSMHHREVPGAQKGLLLLFQMMFAHNSTRNDGLPRFALQLTHAEMP